MADSVLKLRTEAKSLGIENYRRMSASELRDAIERAQSGETPKAAKPKASNGSKPKRKSAKAVKQAVAKPDKPKRTRKATKPAARKPSGRKSVPAAKSPARGKAKRPTATRKLAPVTKPQARRGHKPGRNLIDNAEIDWKAESPVGASGGNRGIIVKALRRYNGDQRKVFAHLQPEAKAMYPKSSTTGERYSKAKAESLLKWHISRVKFDFVMSTGQHEKSKYRAANGTSTDPQAIARRKANASKAAGARRSPARVTKPRAKGKRTTGRAKPAGGRSRARGRSRK